jgi:hypothetical protein
MQAARMDELVLGDLRSLADYDSLRSDPRFAQLEEWVSRRQAQVGRRRPARSTT